MSAVTRSTITSRSTSTVRTAGTSSSSSSSFSIPGVVPADGHGLNSLFVPVVEGGGPVASLEARAAVFKECAAQAIAAANEAVADAAKINSAHAEIVNQHRKLFLAKAFRINPDGTPINNPALQLTDAAPEYKSVKSLQQYNYIIYCLTHWGDNATLKTLPDDEAQKVKAFRMKNRNGYNYEKMYALQETKSPDGTSKILLVHKKNNGIVSHMLDIFDVIHEAHCRMGHMRIEKTLANCRPQFFSPTYDLCKLYIEDCYVQPSIPLRKGAKKPIISSHFRDRIQVDLIDMRTMRKHDVYGLMKRWIMTVKDHSTGLVYLASLPQKKAEYVAAELENYFGFAGFPHILHTDNGKEFIATLVVDMMMRHNPNCFLVTGRPRTPRDQGSVENANKLVKQVLMSISRQRRMEGIETNWTKILGQVMSVCNSHSGIRKLSTSSYEAVFGQPYHPELRCTVSEMRGCRTIEQRLRLSPDERLAKYVRDNDIVDYISELGGGSSLISDIDAESDLNGDDEEEGVDLNDNSFPEALSNNDSYSSSFFGVDFSAESLGPTAGTEFHAKTEDNRDPSVLVHHAGGCSSINHSPSVGGESISSAVDACGPDVFSNPSGGVEAQKSAVHDDGHSLHTFTSSADAEKTDDKDLARKKDALSISSSSTTDELDDSQLQANKVKYWPYTRSADYRVFTLAEAWEHGNIARKHKSLGDNKEYTFLMPTLECEHCCHPHGCFCLQVGDKHYIETITTTTNWYDGLFISTFAQLAAHYAHSTVALPERNMTYPDVLPQLIHVTYAGGQVRLDQCSSLRADTTAVVAVCHERDHYAVLEINLTKKLIRIYDGLNMDLDRWFKHVFYALKRCMLCPLSATPQPIPDEPVLVKRHGRFAKGSNKSIQGYQIVIRDSCVSYQWRYERGTFLRQVDGYNCGPIACVKILEMFGLATSDDLALGYQMGRLRQVVKHYWDRFMDRCHKDMIVRVRELLPMSIPPASTTASSQAATVISAAVMASSKAEVDPNYLCFCYCDSPEMDILRLVCCQNTVHRQCYIAHLMNFTQCPYCRAVVDDVAPFLECPSIPRSMIFDNSTHDNVNLMKSPPPTTPTTSTVKRNLEDMMVSANESNKNTPLRLTDVVRSESQEKKGKGNMNRLRR